MSNLRRLRRSAGLSHSRPVIAPAHHEPEDQDCAVCVALANGADQDEVLRAFFSLPDVDDLADDD